MWKFHAFFLCIKRVIRHIAWQMHDWFLLLGIFFEKGTPE